MLYAISDMLKDRQAMGEMDITNLLEFLHWSDQYKPGFLGLNKCKL